MGYLSPGLTTIGRAMMTEALDGAGVVFTKIVIGDGTGPASDRDATAVVNPIMTLAITGLEKHEDYVVLKTLFNNEQLTTGFYIKELGVYAKQVGSEEEKLYAYRYTATECDYVPANNTGRMVEVSMRVIVAVSDAENISAMIDKSGCVTIEDFEAHIHDYNNPHRVTKAQVGLENVENVAFLDQEIDFTTAESLEELEVGETVRSALGKLNKAIADLAAGGGGGGGGGEGGGGGSDTIPEHTHSTNDITSGVLPLERGGTGTTSLNGLKRQVARSIRYVTATISASGWSGKTYSLEADYPKSACNVDVSLAPTATAAQYQAFAKAKLTGSHNSNVITALGAVPAVDIPVILMVVEVI